jgi:PadR family transcriptional regulator
MKGESYGLEVIERVREMTGGKVKLMQGRVYPILRELEADGFIRSYNGAPLQERGGRPRRYYEITAEGRRVATAEAKAIAGLLKPALAGAR